MTTKDREEIIKLFRDEYKKAYQGILSDEILDQGNKWFEAHLLEEVERAEGRGYVKGQTDERKTATDFINSISS